jgi:hypothetical protein
VCPDQRTGFYNSAADNGQAPNVASSHGDPLHRVKSEPVCTIYHLAQASQTATIANAISQTVRHCSIPGVGIFAGPHR